MLCVSRPAWRRFTYHLVNVTAALRATKVTPTKIHNGAHGAIIDTMSAATISVNAPTQTQVST
jgi:hypothetical protein